MRILVTGAGGQVGQALLNAASAYPAVTFIFCNSSEADITNKQQLDEVFGNMNIDFCINTAAYTAVDKAESDIERAVSINVEGPKNLAEVCKKFNVVLLHLSTDFVFDGTNNVPYTEQDVPAPTSVYGKTKLEGERAIASVYNNYYIIRTSWVYSEFGHNFMKTMLRLAGERDTLSVVNDQQGTPTNANDLADALIHICLNNKGKYGVYHYSNEGETTWYGFAKKIFEVNNISINVQPVPTSAYPTPAKRPAYSVMDKTRIKSVLGVNVPQWEESLMKLYSSTSES